MKRLLILLITIIFAFTAPFGSVVLAEGISSVQKLTIDTENEYKNMSSSYSEGYSPTVSGNSVKIVLPLLDEQGLFDDMDSITASVDLGSTSGSPFVFRTYQKTFQKTNQPINGTAATQQVFLVEFDLVLNTNRDIGVYSVEINVVGTGEDTEGTPVPVNESYTSHITITTGNDPNVTPEKASLFIDTTRIYTGMSTSYSQGYKPTIANSVVSVVLPLQSTGSINGSRITASADLGEASTTPFVIASYNKQISMTAQSTNSGNVSAYYVKFDIPLRTDRENGTYPLVITATGTASSGEPVSVSETYYITITDGVVTPEEGVNGFSIDAGNVYSGMSVAYNQGYQPTVTSKSATIVLPLLAHGNISGDVLTASIDLGVPGSAPFEFKSYTKQVSLASNSTKSGSVQGYYVRFDLALSSDRTNGTYPVTITVSANEETSNPITRTFTSYVRITDGKDPNALPPVDVPAPNPILMVSNVDIPSPIEAGSEFEVSFTISNMHEKSSVKNVMVVLSCDTSSIILQEDSNTFFERSLEENDSLILTAKYKSDKETPEGIYNISAAISYENADDMTLSAAGVATAEIKQATKVELTPPKLPETANAGDTLPIEIQVMNLSRGRVYNVRCELDAPGLIPTGTGFVGNMEGGTAGTADMSVFVGTLDMSEGYEGEEKYGYSFGTMTLIYENARGEEFTEEYEIGINIMQPIITASTDTEEEEVTPTQWWIALVVGGVVVAGLCGAFVIRSRRRKKFLEEE